MRPAHEPPVRRTVGDIMESRMKNPAMVLPGVSDAIQGLVKAAYKGGVSPRTLELVHLRASQINGCSACVDSGA
jgi:alkylhydroperoxidase family enzyme